LINILKFKEGKMKSIYSILIVLILSISLGFTAQKKYEKDTFDTGDGKLTITFIGHRTLMFDYKGMIIHIDPVERYADYKKMPKADMIFITHEHKDHLDKKAVSHILKKETKIIINKASYDILKKGIVMKNGESQVENKIRIEAVPAYNTTKGREKIHPKSRDNGYILGIGNIRIYIAGDTEDIQEMMNIQNIDIAFLPMNQPYTMTPKQVINAVKMFRPKVLYPYHYGDTDVSELSKLMKHIKYTELRIRDLK